MLACYCLNIIIEAEVNDFQKVTSESLNLNDEEKNDIFFKQDVFEVKKMNNITEIHLGLVMKRVLGCWIVNKCINCDCQTHAVHREKGAACVLVYSKLLRSEAIASIRSSEIFSTIFSIVINPNNIGVDDNVLGTYLPVEVEATLKNIKLIMSVHLRKECLEVEERIKKYTEEQYELLNNLKDRAFKEHESLVRVICSTNDQSKPDSTKNNADGNIANPLLRPRRLKDSPTGSLSISGSPLSGTRYTPKRQKSSPGIPVSSIDAEGVFDFEGSDDVNSFSDTDMDDSDREDGATEGILIPRQKLSRGSIAKSLPMNIPNYMAQAKNRNAEDSDDGLPQDENLDIAASIKALAKSVHGDTIFGDLPRPRFSTQI